ncbi:hypothetical protein AN639_07510 [Candidatus Epulonipiscium fishelsonii]|uniref:Uncharacterized protein n=1 Tax=Candidatus Epulonipiscium fishelsonii TaxID=77094 RepID=A0ACC8XEX5_9FIRM|nr:hypothetical protein AN639_07510 [Epulopiscium sp. SCG-B05WGA-EpuloA1]ONI41893.1 hypothetical protein AN396_02860 [Epulopiscium sp. SCG-B11WGA-EpuloA1]ONI48040.1 hypothetical protein AN644_02885 [Epulopiscium sp. SCG-C06WGA-EpuloA1]
MKVVAIGGGTGLSTLLKGLKKYTSEITAIVTVSDNGGGSGTLRQEMHILPPGDIRNCLVSLANTEPIMKNLLQYRFKEGPLEGQSFGNLFLATLSEVSGSFEKAVEISGKVLSITGRVLPVTLEDVDLYATFEDGMKLVGETEIVEYGKYKKAMIKSIILTPKNPKPTPDVINAIEQADVIILGPGSLYTSIISNLLVHQVATTIRKSKAQVFYIANIMSQPGETTGFTVEDHIKALEKYVGAYVIDKVIVNNTSLSKEYIQKYAEEGSHILKWNPNDLIWNRILRIEADVSKINIEKQYIRHQSYKLADCIFENIQRR